MMHEEGTKASVAFFVLVPARTVLEREPSGRGKGGGEGRRRGVLDIHTWP